MDIPRNRCCYAALYVEYARTKIHLSLSFSQICAKNVTRHKDDSGRCTDLECVEVYAHSFIVSITTMEYVYPLNVIFLIVIVHAEYRPTLMCLSSDS